MHRTRAALRNAAAEFRAGQAEHITENPQQWHPTIDICCLANPVDVDRVCHGVLPEPRRAHGLVTKMTTHFRRSPSAESVFNSSVKIAKELEGSFSGCQNFLV
jgi:hypothetical protein